MTSLNVPKFRSVTGYWFGDDARFGRSPMPRAEVSGFPETRIVHRGEVEAVSVAVDYYGLVLADFSGWETEAQPSPDRILDRSPFADDRELADRLFRLGSELLDGFADRWRGAGLVLDVGCGPGHIARYLHERGVEIAGVDLSPRTVEVARKRTADLPFEVGT
jgi:SAM-dependent methyltransferase